MAKNSQLSSNVFLFFGEDEFSLKRKVDHWKAEFAKKYSANSITIIEAADLSESAIIEGLKTDFSPSLFASKKLIVIKDALPTKATQSLLADFLLSAIDTIPKDFFVIFWQNQKPDGRLGFTKFFLSKVSVTQFELPHGLVLNQWISAMTKSLGGKITPAASDKLAVFMGRDLFEEKKVGGRVIERKEAFDLWQVYSELQKLTTAFDTIDSSEVEKLVKPKIPDSVFYLTDEVVGKNQKGSMLAFENFLSTQTADEKASIIKIVALLAEQIRSLLVVALLNQEGLDQEKIAEKLNWSTGRVFITSKNSRNLSVSKLKQLLANLLNIDRKIKTSDSNLKLDVDLFLVQATN
jgi:DNA polymerase III delta subunit